MEFRGFNGRVADDLQHGLVVPHVIFERRHIQVAHDDGVTPRQIAAQPARHLVEEIELVGEFVICFTIRFVAAGGHIKIMHGDGVSPRVARREGHGDMARVALFAELALVDGFEGNARGDAHAVIALLPIDRHMGIAQALEVTEGKFAVAALRFLKADHIGLKAVGEMFDQRHAQPHRIDVPGREFDGHG